MTRRGPLTPAQQARVANYVPLAFKLAGLYARRYRVDRDELLDVAFEAITLAVPSHDPGRGPEPAHVCSKVHYALRDFFRDDRRKNLLRDAVPIGEDDPDRDRASIAMIEAEACVPRLLSLCDDRQRAVLESFYLRGLSDAKIAPRLGLQRRRVYAIRMGAIDHLRGLHGVRPGSR